MIYSSKKNELDKFLSLSESASSADLGHDKEDLIPNDTGFEGIDVEEYLGFNPELGVARNDELGEDPAYGDFFRDPVVMEAFTAHFDLTDKKTRQAILAMNEADQNSVLTALTSKLYDNIVAKVDDIDYGEIPSTKGDVTKLSNYAKLKECIDLLRNILREYKQDTAPIDAVALALANIESRKDMFGRAFRMDVELPIIMYNNMVLAVINGVSYMIATCIEFIKTPNKDTFQISLNKVAFAKTKSNLMYNNLKRFNKCCEKRDFDKSMDHIIKEFVKIHEGAAIAGFFASVGGKWAIAALLLMIIPFLRELVFFFYFVRMRVSEFFDLQADLLQMNAYNVESNATIDDSKKQKIVSGQLKVVEFFRKVANKFSINSKKAEVETEKEISAQSGNMKIDDVTNANVSVLF